MSWQLAEATVTGIAGTAITIGIAATARLLSPLSLENAPNPRRLELGSLLRIGEARPLPLSAIVAQIDDSKGGTGKPMAPRHSYSLEVLVKNDGAWKISDCLIADEIPHPWRLHRFGACG